jgi:hypothetical protein
MSKEQAIHPTKVLRFFNYGKIIAELTSKLQSLERECQSLSEGKNPLSYIVKSPDVCVNQQNNTMKLHHPKKFVIVDHKTAIAELRSKIAYYENKIALARPSPPSSISTRNEISLTPAEKKLNSTRQIGKDFTYTRILFLGLSLYARLHLIKSMLDKNSNIMADREGEAYIFSELLSCELSDTHKLLIAAYGHQQRFDQLFRTALEWSDMLLIFFDLSEASYAEESYDASKARLEYLHQSNIKFIFMLGLHPPNKLDQQALTLFHRFREEEAIDLYLVSEESIQGKQQLKNYLHSLVSASLQTDETGTPADNISTPNNATNPSHK